MTELHTALAGHLEGFEIDALRARFLDHDETLILDDFLPPAVLETLLATLPGLASRVNRNYLPGHKKGGSISRHDLDRHAPLFGALYGAPALAAFLRSLTGRDLQLCPARDPHGYALYYYTEAGDHIGWHYDTSYYRGARYTALLGLVDESDCRLEFELHRRNPARRSERHSIALAPGTLAMFNGDKLRHRITPLTEGGRRIALTLEFLTSAKMSALGRFVSNMKDAVAYFGFRQVFQRR